MTSWSARPSLGEWSLEILRKQLASKQGLSAGGQLGILALVIREVIFAFKNAWGVISAVN
jgi:hypothetical protein